MYRRPLVDSGDVTHHNHTISNINDETDLAPNLEDPPNSEETTQDIESPNPEVSYDRC